MGGTNAVARLRRRHFARCSACRVESSLSLLSSLQGGFMISWLHHREHDEGGDEGDATGVGGCCVQASMVAPHPTPTSCLARPSPHSARSRSCLC